MDGLLQTVQTPPCSLTEFVRDAWHIVEPATPYIHGWHIEAIAEHLEAATFGQIRNLIINIPPRCAKSLLVCVFWFCWVWTFRPSSRWIFSSYAEGLAIRDSLKCRRVIESNWYRKNFGHVFRLAGDQNQKTRFENNKTGQRMAVGVGGAGVGEGGEFLVGDDLLKPGESHSTTVRMGTNTWWDETMSTRGNNPNTVVKVMIMQRLHEEDPTGYLLNKPDGQHYEHLCLPMEYEPTNRRTCIGWSDPRKAEGELLWPERFSKTAVADLKAGLGSYGSAGQLQQRPSPAEGGIFKRHWWRYWKPAGVDLPPVSVKFAKMVNGELVEQIIQIEAVALPARFDEMLQSWDCAFKDSKDNDFVAGQMWGRVKADKFMVDFFKRRVDINGTIAAIRGWHEQYPKAMTKLIEDKANGSAVIQILSREVPGLIPVEPEGGKVSRAHSAAPGVEAGNYYLPHPALYGWVSEFIESCAAFPNAAHDDDVDAFTQAAIRMTTRAGWTRG